MTGNAVVLEMAMDGYPEHDFVDYPNHGPLCPYHYSIFTNCTLL
ncbi:MAG: hypothetical protein R2867_30715 [Caldilineaceae bacterium]